MCSAQLTLKNPQVTAMLRLMTRTGVLRVWLLTGLTAAAETLHLPSACFKLK